VEYRQPALLDHNPIAVIAANEFVGPTESFEEIEDEGTE
jgi:hypothetical protein